MISKKIALSVLCFSIVSQSAFAAEGRSVSYSFLSGGLAFGKSGVASDNQKYLETMTNLKYKGAFRTKSSRLGWYLKSNAGFDNNFFIEARLHSLSNLTSGFFGGVGYHFPVSESSDIYLLGGVSKPVLPFMISLPENDDSDYAFVSVDSKLSPSIEVGYRANLRDELGVYLAYRLTQDNLQINNSVSIQKVSATAFSYKSIKNTETREGVGSEFSAGAHYHFTKKIAAEVGYTFTKLPKFSGTHIGTIGLRYSLL